VSALARQWATNRVRRIARRWGALEARGQLGDPTTFALRQVRALAWLKGCSRDDIDNATAAGTLEGLRS